MDHSNLYEESDQDDYDNLEAEFGARNLLETARNAPGSEEGSAGEDGGGGKFGEASLAAHAESNKAGSEIGIAAAGLGSERWKEATGRKEKKKTRAARKDMEKVEVAFNMAAIMAATMANREDDPMHLQDPLRGDYLEQTGTRDSLTPLWRCRMACATSSYNMASSEDFDD